MKCNWHWCLGCAGDEAQQFNPPTSSTLHHPLPFLLRYESILGAILPSASTHCTFSFHFTFKRLVLQFQGHGNKLSRRLLFMQIMQYLPVVETKSDEYCWCNCFQQCIKPVHTNTSWTILTMRTLLGWRNSSKSTYLCAYLHQYNTVSIVWEKNQILPAWIGAFIYKKKIWSCQTWQWSKILFISFVANTTCIRRAKSV